MPTNLLLVLNVHMSSTDHMTTACGLPLQALRSKKASISKPHSSSLLTTHSHKSNGPPNGELCSPSSPSSYTPSPVTPHSPPSTLSQDRLAPSTSSDGTAIVEIEDPSLKPNRCEPTPHCPTHSHVHAYTITCTYTHRGSRQKDHTPSGFMLPSPLVSMLGPKRTLNLLSESVSSESGRPLRKARMRARGEGEWGKGAREKAKAQQETEQKER